ncbi:TonB-dependent receptor [Gibbsiella quercinecans]|uniref:TonB-dependent receptor domain-containing protein n=1 Tax=Gibbsiella quercinecans TaxID=929813 RepID=UPI000EF2564F|nr:TonB-dependent receptor [Gibbsiella quercinecans]RLM02190.1 TonB-dependent receptor [Gibbsiella quercinecans]
MINTRYLPGLGILMLGTGACAQATETGSANTQKGESVFSPLVVQAGRPSAEQEALSRAGAYSSVDENRNLQSTDSVLRGMPGTYTQLDAGQGAVSVNIRGMTGFGRVNTMVDGITQTFYGSSSGSMYHGGMPNSQFGTLIDPNFIIGIDVARGNVSGADGVNTLTGSANFRTIGVDDVVFSDNPFGIRTKFGSGNNGIGRTGMVAVGGKFRDFGNSGSIGVMAAMSGSSIDSNYKNGAGQNSDEFFTEKTFRQSPQSQLYKIDFKPDEFNSLELSARNYVNKISQRLIASQDWYLKYHYTPFSEWVDFNFTASSSRGEQEFLPGTMGAIQRTKAKNISEAFDINNTSRFSAGDVDAELSYGAKMTKNQYIKKKPGNMLLGEDQEYSTPVGLSGRQKISALYTGLQLNYGILQGNADVNYTRYDLSGFKPACDPRVVCFPQGASQINRNDSGLNPSVMLTAKVAPWFQPFVSWSHSSRGPNVQEAFFSTDGGEAMNPFLKGESANTWQLGFNTDMHELLTRQDRLLLKAVFFESRIKNYIYSEKFRVFREGGRLSRGDAGEDKWDNGDIVGEFSHLTVYTNAPDTVRSRGIELEALYDTGFAWGKLSLSRERTDQPLSYASKDFGGGDITQLPGMSVTLDSGIRLLDSRLTLGSVVKYTGDAVKTSPEEDYSKPDTGNVEKEEIKKIPVVFDLYSSYEINRNVMLKFSVQNVMNKDYHDALNKLNWIPNQSSAGEPANTARGRTYIFGGEIRF